MVDLEYHIDDIALVPIDLYFVAKLPKGLRWKLPKSETITSDIGICVFFA